MSGRNKEGLGERPSLGDVGVALFEEAPPLRQSLMKRWSLLGPTALLDGGLEYTHLTQGQPGIAYLWEGMQGKLIWLNTWGLARYLINMKTPGFYA